MKLHRSAIAALLALSGITPGYALENTATDAGGAGHRMNGDQHIARIPSTATHQSLRGCPGLRKALAGVGRTLFSPASSSAVRRKKHMSDVSHGEMQSSPTASTADGDLSSSLWNEIVDEAALDGTEDQRDLVEDLSSWDGWKFMKPSTDPGGCSDGVAVVNCLSASDNDTILWMHDDKGHLTRKKDQGLLCLGYTQVDSDYEPDFQACQDGVDAQVWTRTPSGQLLNKATDKVLVKKVCGQALSPLVLLDDLDVPEDGCDLWAVVGPNDHDPDDHGSAYFAPIGDKIVSPNDSTDYSFASSVSMNDAGNIVVIGGSVVSGDGTSYSGLVVAYERNGNSWTEKSTYTPGYDQTVRPKVEVTINGDGDKVAMAIAGTKDSGVIVVLSYVLGSGYGGQLGQDIETKSSGELPGVKLAMDKTGNTLLVGEPYYDLEDGTAMNAGRVRIFLFDSSEGKYFLDNFIKITGNMTDTRVGSAVSINGDGDLIAYGVAGHLTDDKGLVEVLKKNGGPYEPFGPGIFGVEENDEAGSSIKITEYGDKVHLAVGAVYNDGNGQINSGHVRVFSCDSSNCQAWAQVGSDIDGDHGVVFDGDSFHVGDAFGFSLDMSEKGDMIVIGAPFYSASRASDYYSGNTKLYALESNEWTQLGHDITGESNQENAGYSVGLSKDGLTLVIGSPGLGPGSPQGSAQIFSKLEVSNSPSRAPSALPTDSPSESPSTSPSQAPTLFVGRLFEIRSTYERFGKVVQSDEDWCIEADKDAPFSKLNMRPCDGSARQLWFQDVDGKILLKGGTFGITYEGKKLQLRAVGMANTFDINETEKSISTTKSGGKFLIGIDPSKLFSRLRLYKEGGDNQSVYKWHIELFGPSNNPTMAPTLSVIPTLAPSLSSLCSRLDCDWTALGQNVDPGFGQGTSLLDTNGDGTRFCVGYPHIYDINISKGMTRVYDLKDGSTWVQIGQDIWGENIQDTHGRCSLSSDGTRLAVGGGGASTPNGDRSGQAKIYDYDGTNWIQKGQTIYGAGAGDNVWGGALARPDGSRVLIATNRAASGKGYMRVYELNGNQWEVLGGDMWGLKSEDRMGWCASISADGNRALATSVVGSYLGQDQSGYAVVFEYQNGVWNQLGQVIGGQMNGSYEHNQQFGNGCDISASGNRVAVGAFNWNDQLGFVKVFDLDDSGTEWKEQATIVDTNFGKSQILCGVAVSCGQADCSRLAIHCARSGIHGGGFVRILDLEGDTWVQKGG